MTVKPTRHRAPIRLAALLMIAAAGVTACDSQPSAKRVAEDLVKSLPGATDAQRECMLEVLDGYSKDELQAIGNGVSSGNTKTKAESEAALKKFEADLADCR